MRLPPGKPRWLRTLRWALLLIVLSLVYLGSSGQYYVGLTNDDSLYLSTGRAMARGMGYVDLHLPDHPHHQKYPPGYPFLISLVERVWPGSLTAQRGLNLVLSLACVPAVFWLAEGSAPVVRYGAAVLTGLNAYWAEVATTVASEPAYTLLVLIFCAVYRRPCTPRRTVALGLVAGMAFYVRAAAVLLWAAAALAMASRRQRRLVPWALLTVATVLPYLLGVDRSSGYREAAAAPLHLADNLALYWNLPLLLWGNPWVLATLSWAPVFIIWGWALLARGLWLSLRGERLTALLVLITLAFQLVWPYLDFRFFLPVLPLLYLLALEGAAARRGLLVAVVATGLAGNLVFLALDERTTLTAPVRPPLATYQWVREHAGPEDVLTSEYEDAWLYTGHTMVHLFVERAAAHPDAWAESLRRQGVRWVVLTRVEERHRALLSFLWTRADLFAPVYQNRAEQAMVFSVR